jgi:CNT family concentrative nucleoside transporter
MSELALRGVSAFGFFAMIGIAWLCSSDRRRVPWRTLVWGVGLQLALAEALLGTRAGRLFFRAVNALVDAILGWVHAGSRFVFGGLLDTGFSFALEVLPIIVFMASLFSVLYHLGIVQRIVSALAFLLARSMRLSGAESLAAVANIFVGMVESCLVVKPYVAAMTRSELFTTMSLGMATVAGSVLLAYVGILGGGDFAGHLVTASLLSAPAGILIAKVMVPETEVPETAGGAGALDARSSVNVIDAAAEGAVAGLRLAAYVGAMLLAFVALIAMANDGLSGLGTLVGLTDLSFQKLLGWLLAPLAFLMGVPWADAPEVGALLGLKTVINEFVAYQQLGTLMQSDAIGHRSAVIASYALCGFANFGSLAILLGGIGGIAPERRHEIASLGLRSIVAGSLTTFMTACVAGVFL